jgi:hypothetical protein
VKHTGSQTKVHAASLDIALKKNTLNKCTKEEFAKNSFNFANIPLLY